MLTNRTYGCMLDQDEVTFLTSNTLADVIATPTTESISLQTIDSMCI